MYVPESKRTRLISVCRTRFIERHDSVIVFVELFEAIVHTLSEISSCGRSIASSANTLLASIEKGNFIESFFVAQKLLCTTHSLSNTCKILIKI